MSNSQTLATGFTILCFTTTVFAADIFSSNNTGEISVETAYNRLVGKEQSALQDTVINIMQKNHIEQGKSDNILGTYQMSSDKAVTADNTEVFITSSNQKLPNQKIFDLAKEMAVTLNQESIAVFIPSDQAKIGDLKLKFTSQTPTINEAIASIQTKLPASYSQAFSLRLMTECADFNNKKVAEVEWLGSKIKAEDIQKAFPKEKVSYRKGDAFLVYQSGKKEQL